MQLLEQIVEELETGDLPLEKAIKKFEEGIQLSKTCSEMLDATEKKITILIKGPDGTIIERPFVDDADETSPDRADLKSEK